MIKTVELLIAISDFVLMLLIFYFAFSEGDDETLLD